MPTVLQIGPFRFHFYSDEGNELPHIHIRTPQGECKFWLTPIGLSSSGQVPPHQIRQIERLVFENQKHLTTAYHEHHHR